ncbi:FG-GAP-like repeat-containing protein [Photobacterium sp. R1]
MKINQLTFLITGITLLSVSSLSQASSWPGVQRSNYGIDLSGQADVDQNGAANYRLALELPPGIKGHAPDLALHYNSQSKDGIFGAGWSLSGLSSISRCPSNNYLDGYIDIVDFDEKDKFCLDGERLIIVDESTANQTEYRTARESYRKVIALGPKNNPSMFQVWNPDGFKSEYTSNVKTANKRKNISWSLMSTSDKAGNEIHYEYKTDPSSGESIISEISYNSNHIKFNYENKIHKISSYVHGNKTSLNHRIDEITISQIEEPIRNYKFKYQSGNDILQKITTANSGCKDETCEVSIDLKWKYQPMGNFSAAKHLIRSFGKDAEGWNNKDHIRLTSDIDGDGRTDIIGFSNNGVQVSFSEGNTYSSPRQLINYFGKDAGKWSNSDHIRTVADVNGDGLTDIIGFSNSGVQVSFSQGRSFSSPRNLLKAFGKDTGWTVKDHPRIMADVNGDGKADIVGFGNNGVYVSFSTGNSFSTPKHMLRAFGKDTGGWSTNDHIRTMADINGDGRADIVGFSNSGVEVSLSQGNSFSAPKRLLNTFGKNDGWKNYDHPRFLADANGDGKADIIGFSHNGVIVSFSKGDGFTAPKRLINSFGNGVGGWNTSDHPRTVADVNGDGRADIIGFANDGVNISFSLGETFTAPKRVINSFGKYSGGWSTKDHLRMLADTDGDGTADIIGFGNAGVYISNSTSASPLLLSVTSSLGNVVTFDYSPLTDNNVYKKLNSEQYPISEVQAPIYVVKSLHRSSQNSKTHSSSYYYHGFRVHKLGAGSLGFSKIQNWDQSNNLITTTTYSQNTEDLLQGALVKREICIFDGRGKISFDYCDENPSTLLEQTVNQWKVYKPTGIPEPIERFKRSISFTSAPVLKPAQRYIQHLIKSTTKKWDLNGELISTQVYESEFEPDYGQLIRKTIETQDHINQRWHKEITSNSYVPVTSEIQDRWLINLIEHQSTFISGSHLKSTENTVRYEYNELGLLTKEVREEGEPEQFATSYSDFDRGLAQTVTESWQRLPNDGLPSNSRTTQLSYDAFGFIKSRTNAVGYQTNYQYDPRSGLLLNSTDTNGRQVNNFYDDWGRLIGERLSDGSWKTTTYKQSHDQEVAYRILAQRSDAPTVEHYIDALHREVRRDVSLFGGEKSISVKKYDSLGRLIFESAPDYHVSYEGTSFEYDLLNRVKQITRADNSKTTYFYEPLTMTSVNAKGQKAITRSNAWGWNIEKSDDNNNTTAYRYDGRGNIIETIDPNGNKIIVDYDRFDRKTSIHDPNTGSNSYTLNGLGLISKSVNGNNQSIIFEYDLLGRQTYRNIEDVKRKAGNIETIWKYSESHGDTGLLESITQDNYIERYSYDAQGRMSSKKINIGNNEFNYQWSYDNNGRVEEKVLPNDLSVQYIYDQFGYLTTIKNSTERTPYWELLSMDTRGNITSTQLGGGITTTKYFDSITGNLTNISSNNLIGKTIQSVNYEYDEIGNVTQKSWSQFNKSFIENFEYDSLNRLISSSGVSNQDLKYDALGNITYKSDVGTYQYNSSRPHAVSSISGIRSAEYLYDNAGNQIEGDGRTITYSAFNKPLTISNKEGTTTFEYGPSLERTIRNDVNKNRTTYYVDRDYEQVNENGKITHRYFIADQVIVEKDSEGSAKNKYLFKDHLNSVLLITDQLGEIEYQTSYDAWGKSRILPGQEDYELSQNSYSDGLTGRLGFSSHENLTESNLVHMTGRLYDPVIGRFLNPDPIVQDDIGGGQGFNRYSYVQNNPLKYTDPSGYSISGFFKKTGKFIDKYWKVGVAIAASVFTYGYASGWAAGFLSSQVAIGATGGAAAGFVSGAILSGTWEGAFQGALAGMITGGFSKLTGSWKVDSLGTFAKRIGTSAVGGCASAAAVGGRCSQGARLAGIGEAFRAGIEWFTGYEPTTKRATQGALNKTNSSTSGYSGPAHNPKLDICSSDFSKCGPLFNQVGEANSSHFLMGEKGAFMSFLSTKVPGFNSGAVLHDVFVGTVQRSLGIWSNPGLVSGIVTNQVSIIPVIAFNYAALHQMVQLQAYQYEQLMKK